MKCRGMKWTYNMLAKKFNYKMLRVKQINIYNALPNLLQLHGFAFFLQHLLVHP